MHTLIIASVIKFDVTSDLYERIKNLTYRYDYARCLEEKEGDLYVRSDNLYDSQRTLEAIYTLLLHELTDRLKANKEHAKSWLDVETCQVTGSRALIEKLKSEEKHMEAYWQTIDLLGELFSYRHQVERDKTIVHKKKER